MAFLKFANAVIVNNLKSWNDWSKISSHFSSRTASKVVAEYDPKRYLLTHCTIIASVDVEDWKEHYITPQTAQFVNNNYDAWERNLLLSCYKTFVGADNFVEHVQIPEQSKGKVIDAVAREVIFPGKTAGEGDSKSVYVDILVATDRKHEDLVRDIETRKKDKLSMGCIVAFTICSQCGNKAEDAVQLCHHIKYLKGNKFIDENGDERIIAELCGHKDDPESVKFIDASWVKNPAFEGAVTRNIVAPHFELRDKLKSAFEIKPLIGSEGLKIKKVANTNQYILAQDEPAEEAPVEEAPVEEAPVEEAPVEEAPVEEAPVEEAETPKELEKPVTFIDIKNTIKDQIKERAKEEAKGELLKELSDEIAESQVIKKFIPDEGHTQETLVKSKVRVVKDKGLDDFVNPDASKSFRDFESFRYNNPKQGIEAFINRNSADLNKEISKIFGERKSVSIRQAIGSLYQGQPWISLKKYGLNGKDGVLLSAYIDSRVHKQASDSRLYKAALKARDFEDEKNFLKYCEDLFGRKLNSSELKKIALEIKRFNLLEQEIF